MISWVNSKLTRRVVHGKVMKQVLSESGYCYQQAVDKNYDVDNDVSKQTRTSQIPERRNFYNVWAAPFKITIF